MCAQSQTTHGGHRHADPPSPPLPPPTPVGSEEHGSAVACDMRLHRRCVVCGVRLAAMSGPTAHYGMPLPTSQPRVPALARNIVDACMTKTRSVDGRSTNDTPPHTLAELAKRLLPAGRGKDAAAAVRFYPQGLPRCLPPKAGPRPHPRPSRDPNPAPLATPAPLLSRPPPLSPREGEARAAEGLAAKEPHSSALALGRHARDVLS